MMVLYVIALVPLAEEVLAAYPWIITTFYADNTAFDISAWRIAQLLKLLLGRGPGQGYFLSRTGCYL